MTAARCTCCRMLAAARCSLSLLRLTIFTSAPPLTVSRDELDSGLAKGHVRASSSDSARVHREAARLDPQLQLGRVGHEHHGPAPPVKLAE